MSLLRAAFTGDYKPFGNVADADCIIGQSFGVREAVGLPMLKARGRL